MDIVKFSIQKPVIVVVGVIFVVLFGLIGLFQMPYQLSPDVTVPEIEVRTAWPGATPYEIERDVIEEQEKALKGIPGLTEMESTSYNDQGSVTLRFTIGTNVDDALLRVSNKLNEVPSYPENGSLKMTILTLSARIEHSLRTRSGSILNVWRELQISSSAVEESGRCMLLQNLQNWRLLVSQLMT
jgi:HAE1 family hydrophobic/amphiphilic exporter-1